GLLHAPGRPDCLRACADKGGFDLQGRRRLGAQGNPQCGLLGQVLQRPDHPGIRHGHLADPAVPRRVGRAADPGWQLTPNLIQTGDPTMDQIAGKRTGASQPEETEQPAADPLAGDGLYPRGLPPPGAPAGLEPSELSQRPTVAGSVRVTCIDYCPDKFLVQEGANLPDLLTQHRPGCG